MVSNTTDYMHCPDWETGVKDSEDTLSHDCYHNAMKSGGGWVGATCVCVWVDVCDCVCVWIHVTVFVLCVDVSDSVCLSYSSLCLGFGLTPLHHAEVAV